MPSSLVRVGLLAATAAGLVGLVPTFMRAEPAATPAPVANIKELMNAFNHEAHGMYGLVKATLNAGEPSANDWKIAGFRAVAVSECGNLLMGLTPPRGAEDDAGKAKWAAHAAAFRDCARELAKHVKQKKLPEAKAQLAEVKKRCDACHADHQLE
jgi:hypothetical protein